MQPKFLKNINFENVTGVYLPYIVVDAKVHCTFIGTDKKYLIYRSDFNVMIDDLTIEAINNDDGSIRTNNIINSIMPFDTENCVKFESNYLIGYTCENRNLNIYDLENEMDKQIKDIVGKHIISSSTNRGIQWNSKDYYYNGRQIISSYLPVWIYSYHEKRRKKKYNTLYSSKW